MIDDLYYNTFCLKSTFSIFRLFGILNIILLDTKLEKILLSLMRKINMPSNINCFQMWKLPVFMESLCNFHLKYASLHPFAGKFFKKLWLHFYFFPCSLYIFWGIIENLIKIHYTFSKKTFYWQKSSSKFTKFKYRNVSFFYLQILSK